MKAELKLQQLNLKLALNWLDIIELCDANIANGIDADWHKQKRQSAVERYAEAMTAIVKGVVEVSNVNIEKLVAA